MDISQLLTSTLPNAMNAVQAAMNPMNGTDMMNGSFSEEAVKTHQQAQDNLIDQARAEAIRQDPTLNYVQRQIATGLIGAKQDWNNAYQSGNAAGMVNAANSAKSLREQAASIGWDPSAYGENVSLHDAAMNLANNDTRALNNMFYTDMDSGTYLENEYKRLKEAGVSHKRALEEANNRAANYQSERIKALRDAFRMYGTDGRGGMTDNGVSLMQMLAEETKDQASVYGNMYASPVQQWNFNNALLTAANAQRDALERSRLSNALTMQRDAKNLEYDMTKSAYNHQLQRDDAMFRQQLKNSEQERAYNILLATGLTPEEAAMSVLGVSRGKSGSGDGDKNKQEKMTPAQEKTIQSLANLIDLAERDISNTGKSSAEDGENLDAIEKFADEAYSKGEIDKETYDAVMQRHYDLNVVRQKKHGYAS